MRVYVLILFCALLGACGVKPDFVDPPAGGQKDRFPRTYPDMATDPAPANPL